MPVYTDQLGNAVDIPSFPQRIVSLVPSQTELLYHLGLDARVSGITKFCVHPDSWFRSKTRIGGTKTVKTDLIAQLQPDLVLANKEENKKDQVEALQKLYPVWVSDVHDLESALEMIAGVGAITGTAEKAAEIISRVRTGFAELETLNFKFKTAYLIWRNPYMTIGSDTFIHDMLNRCGLENIFGNQTRYPETTIEQLRNKNCELLLLPSEPYPFKENHVSEIQSELPNTKILLCDGEMFSWYGSRLLGAPTYFKKLLSSIKKPTGSENLPEHLPLPWHWSTMDMTSQLKKELHPDHILFGKKVKSIGRRQDNDDTLFEIESDQYKYAVVHLTWSQTRQQDSRWPATTLYKDWNDLYTNRISKDNESWKEDEGDS